MKDRAFSTNLMVTSVVAMVIGILLPVQAFAAVCFQDQLGDTFVIEVAVQAGQFFSLVGEVVGSASGNGIIQSGASFPLVGSAHLRGDGTAHFGITVHADDETHFPMWSQGILNPPDFNTGSGFLDELGLNFVILTFSPATCPALPQ